MGLKAASNNLMDDRLRAVRFRGATGWALWLASWLGSCIHWGNHTQHGVKPRPSAWAKRTGCLPVSARQAAFVAPAPPRERHAGCDNLRRRSNQQVQEWSFLDDPDAVPDAAVPVRRAARNCAGTCLSRSCCRQPGGAGHGAAGSRPAHARGVRGTRSRQVSRRVVPVADRGWPLCGCACVAGCVARAALENRPVACARQHPLRDVRRCETARNRRAHVVRGCVPRSVQRSHGAARRWNCVRRVVFTGHGAALATGRPARRAAIACGGEHAERGRRDRHPAQGRSGTDVSRGRPAGRYADPTGRRAALRRAPGCTDQDR